MRISADSVGLIGRWTPADGLTLRFAAPNPAVAINDTELALDIPDLSAGFAGLSDTQWDAIEFLAGQLARLTPESGRATSSTPSADPYVAAPCRLGSATPPPRRSCRHAAGGDPCLGQRCAAAPGDAGGAGA